MFTQSILKSASTAAPASMLALWEQLPLPSKKQSESKKTGNKAGLFLFVTGMKRIITIASALLVCLSLGAGNVYPKPTKTVLLYPEGQTSGKGITENGAEITCGAGESNGYSKMSFKDPTRMKEVGDDAFMDIYIPKKHNGQMIICCPGGGYSILAFVGEGKNVAAWAMRNSVALCVLHYRLPNGHCTVPLTDVQNAFRYCRAHAGEWGISQIGVMGFSAGGHLAASATVLWKDAVTRPDFSVLIYPVIDLGPEIWHKGTAMRLTGGDEQLLRHYTLQNHVNAFTPPTLLMLSADDTAVNPQNSISFFQKMQEHKVKGEIHIFPKGGHGWGFTTSEFGTDKIAAYRDEFFASLSRFLSERRAEAGLPL